MWKKFFSTTPEPEFPSAYKESLEAASTQLYKGLKNNEYKQIVAVGYQLSELFISYQSVDKSIGREQFLQDLQQSFATYNQVPTKFLPIEVGEALDEGIEEHLFTTDHQAFIAEKDATLKDFVPTVLSYLAYFVSFPPGTSVFLLEE